MAEKTPRPTGYPLNTRVLVRITGHIPSGLLGEVEGGARAIVRNREIAWDVPAELSQYLGQTYEAIVIGRNPARQELELSLRFADRDPWKQAPAKYPPSSTVRGQVSGLIDRGAFVQLEPGVQGLLPLRELPLPSMERIEDWLWPGDEVKAMVVAVSYEQRRLLLSLNSLLYRREVEFQRRLWPPSPDVLTPGAPVEEMLPENVRSELLRLHPAPERPALGTDLAVLAIEDDQTYANGLASLLRYNGCEVTCAADGQSGLDLAQAGAFDLIVIDWNLPHLSGYRVLQALRAAHCPSRLVLLLNPTPVPGRPGVWHDLEHLDVDALSKTDAEGCETGLLAILRELREGHQGTPSSQPRHSPDPMFAVHPGGPPPAAADAAPRPTDNESLLDVLRWLQRDTQATAVSLLRLDPGRPRVLTEASVGISFPPAKAPPDLIHSPLSDVLEGGAEVCATISPASSQFDRLTRLVPFQAFLGMPVPPVGRSRYGLVLLKSQGSFGPSHVQLVRLCTYLLGGKLQERHLTRVLQPWQAQNLAGQLTGSLVHEVTNKLGGISYQVETIRKTTKELVRYPSRSRDLAFLRELEQAAETLSAAQREALRLRDRYLGLTADDESQPVDLGRVAEDMVQLLRDQTQNLNLVVLCRADKDLPTVRARPSLLRQILLNLLLNAMQHMERLHRKGILTIEIRQEREAALPLKVRVSDEGPGIHRQLWERIFDFGFTTKESGAGLGLTISRRIAATLGGQLRVESSYVLWGTTFVLELPKGG